jgi:hypothetical protein
VAPAAFAIASTLTEFLASLRQKERGLSEDISVIVPPCRAEYSLIRLRTEPATKLKRT